jgi:hypothetical protein
MQQLGNGSIGALEQCEQWSNVSNGAKEEWSNVNKGATEQTTSSSRLFAHRVAVVQRLPKAPMSEFTWPVPALA